MAVLPDYQLHPNLSWLLSSTILDTPAADAAKVRMYELLGADLQRYGMTTRPDVSLMYTWTSKLLAEYLAAAFFIHGLHAPTTEALLGSPP
jgi:hypothetical protein